MNEPNPSNASHVRPRPRFSRLFVTLALAGLGLTGCGEASDSGDSGLGDGGALEPGVGQGGAQDFGQFRQILEDGGIPGPETIDDVGFFNEHVLELPAADCGQDVCLHAQLGVMGNMFNGANCTLVWAGMNSPLDPDELERPALNLAIAIDTSGSMQGDGIAYVRSGLHQMLGSAAPRRSHLPDRFLEPGDRPGRGGGRGLRGTRGSDRRPVGDRWDESL